MHPEPVPPDSALSPAPHPPAPHPPAPHPPLHAVVTGERTHARYWRFYDAVAAIQLAEWLPDEPSLVLDLSGCGGRFAESVAAAGHRVLHVSDDADPMNVTPEGQLQRVVAETQELGWLADGAVDAVLAEAGALSTHLATEQTFTEIARVLRPGGRFFVCLDSLVLGLARLAEQGEWAVLADVPSEDVVLVPNEDGSIQRCFWPEELAADLDECGFDVEWLRPRTVLSQDAVERAMANDPASLETLVRTEVALAKERQGESTGIHLVAAAVRR